MKAQSGRSMMSFLRRAALLGLCAASLAMAQTLPPPSPASSAQAAPVRTEPVLGVGDILKITVYQNPDLSIDTRVSELGQINFPLVGIITVGGLAVSAAEQRIEKMLRDGGFVIKPQVSIATVQIRSSQVSILGQVAKPGRFPIEIVGSRVSEMIAAAGGVVPGGADVVTLVGNRNGKPIKLDIDLPLILQQGRADLDIPVENGDIVFVDRAPSFYMYGEVQRPGQMRIERNMTLLQALAGAGGLTARGTERGVRVHRKDASGKVQILEMKMNDPIERDDVIYVRESIF